VVATTAEVSDALLDLASLDSVKHSTRDSTAAVVRDSDGSAVAVFVFVLQDGLSDGESFRTSLMRNIGANGPAIEVPVRSLTVYTFQRNGWYGATWLDGSFDLLLRGEQENAVLAVARAMISNRP
jgi:hypothetical protein